ELFAHELGGCHICNYSKNCKKQIDMGNKIIAKYPVSKSLLNWIIKLGATMEPCEYLDSNCTEFTHILILAIVSV
ncbi:43264_t:CDS:2, partial [Gigaspora margarita]